MQENIIYIPLLEFIALSLFNLKFVYLYLIDILITYLFIYINHTIIN